MYWLCEDEEIKLTASFLTEATFLLSSDDVRSAGHRRAGAFPRTQQGKQVTVRNVNETEETWEFHLDKGRHLFLYKVLMWKNRSINSKFPLKKTEYKSSLYDSSVE